MGGHALSSTSVRLTKKDYDRVSGECVAKLRALYPGKRIEALGSYKSKADFGDCDILVEASFDYGPHRAAEVLGAVEVVRNGPVTSVGLLVDSNTQQREGNMFQVDLIKMDPEAFDFALGYFGHGDTGNLLGRIAHSQGVALRHDGLVYYYRDGDYKFREILLTRKFSEALPFMGYPADSLDQGFESKEDIYRFVASSPFFNRDIYLLENRNAKSRVRDNKRVMYMEFLQWCEARPELPAFEYPENKAEWLPRIAEYFPHFQAAYDKALSDLAELRAVKAKFNGDLVSAWTGLEGKQLGQAMAAWRKKFESAEALHHFVLSQEQTKLQSNIVALVSELDLGKSA